MVFRSPMFSIEDPADLAIDLVNTPCESFTITSVLLPRTASSLLVGVGPFQPVEYGHHRHIVGKLHLQTQYMVSTNISVKFSEQCYQKCVLI